MVASPDCFPIGNSARRMKRTLPASMYSRLSVGKVSARNLRQMGQVMEAYWTMTTGASLRPSDISGSSPGLRISSIAGFLITSRCPTAEAGASENGLNAGPASAVMTPDGVAAEAVAGALPLADSVSPSPLHPATAVRRSNAGNVERVRNGPSCWLVSGRGGGGDGLLEVL